MKEINIDNLTDIEVQQLLGNISAKYNLIVKCYDVEGWLDVSIIKIDGKVELSKLRINGRIDSNML